MSASNLAQPMASGAAPRTSSTSRRRRSRAVTNDRKRCGRLPLGRLPLGRRVHGCLHGDGTYTSARESCAVDARRVQIVTQCAGTGHAISWRFSAPRHADGDRRRTAKRLTNETAETHILPSAQPLAIHTDGRARMIAPSVKVRVEQLVCPRHRMTVVQVRGSLAPPMSQLTLR
jgi:hypothetical protein